MFEELVTEFQPRTVLDPFAGTGRIHALSCPAVGVELEPEWAEMHPRTIVGDAVALPFPSGVFDAVITSCCYANRMADHHNARDGSKRHTYRHYLGRPLSDGSAAGLQWGGAYRALHRKAWSEVERVLVPGGLFVLNISNHIRRGVVEEVAEWHVGAIVIDHPEMELIRTLRISTPRQRHGKNSKLRLDHEFVFVFRKDGD